MRLAMDFQRRFLSEKYNIDDLELLGQPNLFENINYFDLNFNSQCTEIHNIIKSKSEQLGVHRGNVTILASSFELLREIDQMIRQSGEKTATMFESQDQYEDLRSKHDDIKLKLALNDLRQSRKFNFWPKPGTTKLSTIQSFKGWEAHTLFLIIANRVEKDGHPNHELIYTAITRCKQNLFVINLGNENYREFFLTHIPAN